MWVRDITNYVTTIFVKGTPPYITGKCFGGKTHQTPDQHTYPPYDTLQVGATPPFPEETDAHTHCGGLTKVENAPEGRSFIEGQTLVAFSTMIRCP